MGKVGCDTATAHIRDDTRTSCDLNPRGYWVALCGVERPPSSMSLGHFDEIVMGHIEPFATLTLCRACVLAAHGSDPEDLCATCHHANKHHSPGRCRKHGCGCGGFVV